MDGSMGFEPRTINAGGWGGGWGGFGGGFGGGGIVEGLILGAVLGNGRGFGFNGNNRDGCCDNDGRVFAATTLSKLGNIEGAIPLAASTIQNSLLEQTNAFSNQINQANIAQLGATSQVKDSVQNGVTALLLNNNQNTQSILSAICGLGSKMDQNTITQLQTELMEQRGAFRSKETEVNVTQTVSQNQAQQQFQAQQQQQFQILANLGTCMQNLANDIQVVKQGQTIFNSGTMAASGTQAAANTAVK